MDHFWKNSCQYLLYDDSAPPDNARTAWPLSLVIDAGLFLFEFLFPFWWMCSICARLGMPIHVHVCIHHCYANSTLNLFCIRWHKNYTTVIEGGAEMPSVTFLQYFVLFFSWKYLKNTAWFRKILLLLLVFFIYFLLKSCVLHNRWKYCFSSKILFFQPLKYYKPFCKVGIPGGDGDNLQ